MRVLLAIFIIGKGELSQWIATFTCNSAGIAPTNESDSIVETAVCFCEVVLEDKIILFIDKFALHVISDLFLILSHEQHEGEDYSQFREF